jgi:hypothetical protein
LLRADPSSRESFSLRMINKLKRRPRPNISYKAFNKIVISSGSLVATGSISERGKLFLGGQPTWGWSLSFGVGLWD